MEFLVELLLSCCNLIANSAVLDTRCRVLFSWSVQNMGLSLTCLKSGQRVHCTCM